MVTQQTAEQATGAGIALPIAASTIMAGADPLGLLLGLVSATMITFLLGGIDNRWKAIAGILFAAMLTGYAAPVVAAGILHQWPDWKPVMDLARPLVSIFIGGAAPTIIPSFLKGLARRAERIGGGE
jgi:hypothetical protein